MLFGCLGVLMLAAGFISEMPENLRLKLEPTNEVSGVFTTQKRTPAGKTFETKGTYRLRPGRDFEWRTNEPFDSLFISTPEKYIYSNEDEVVERALDDLPGSDRFAALAQFGSNGFLKVFDALYKEESGKCYLKAKPKQSDLKRFLERIEAEGAGKDWQFKATFMNRIEFTTTLKDN